MTVEKIRDEGQILDPPTGKVVGIIESRAEFDNAARALQAAGFEKIEVLSGEEGIHLLDRVNSFFFSDMEERVLNRHIDELRQGHLSILITSPSDRMEEAAAIATQHGARRLVHFGAAVVTWLTK